MRSPAKTQRRQENREVSILIEFLCVFASWREQFSKENFKYQQIELSQKVESFIIAALLLVLCAGQVGELMASEYAAVAVVKKLLPAMAIGSFSGAKNVEIIYGVREVESENGAVIIVNGRNETFVKYREVIDSISKAGFSVYTFDHRGQGFSERQLSDPHKGHVETYDDYVADFEFFLENVVNLRPHKVRLLLAHSMGGTIALLHELRYPESSDAIVMTAPMLGFSTSPWPFFLVPPMLSLFEVLGLEQNYVVGGGGFKPQPFTKDNPLTSDPNSYMRNQQMMLDYPQAQLGSPTCAWVKTSLVAIKEIKDSALSFKVPLLILQAEDDQVVNNRAQECFCREVGENCKLMVIPGAKHEILMEKPEIKELADKIIFDFLKAQIPTGVSL